MTRGTILLFSIFCSLAASPLAVSHQNSPQSEPATKPSEPTTPQGQGTTPATQSPSSSPTSVAPQATPPAKPRSGTARTTHKRPRHKKRVIPANCLSTPAPTTPATPADPVASSPESSAPPAATSSAPTNCPPPKVIVRHGGTSEQSIQLAGGSGGTSQRDTANQMLGATEANLKKIAGNQLTPSQQEMVNQIRQFMEQSKAAVGDGDLERARTLAWKAQLLSEELVKPPK